MSWPVRTEVQIPSVVLLEKDAAATSKIVLFVLTVVFLLAAD